MKKKLLVSILLFLSIPLAACQVILQNNSDMAIFLTDLQAGLPTIPVAAGMTMNANKNPHAHARLKLTIGPQTYIIKQRACSSNNLIPITSQEIVSGTGTNLLTIEKQ